jgi:hypothetical protein
MYVNQEPGVNFGVHSFFFQDELVETNDCPTTQNPSSTLKLLIPDYLNITNWSSYPTILQELRMTDFFFTTKHIISNRIRYSLNLTRNKFSIELIEMLLAGGGLYSQGSSFN